MFLEPVFFIEVELAAQTRGGPDNLRWFWSMTVNGPMTRCDLGRGQGAVQKSWDEWKAWAGLEEVP
jgi:hypothetical protein